MEPHGHARGTSMKYPPMPLGAEALRLPARSRFGEGRARRRQGSGGLSTSGEIRQSINSMAHE